MLFVDELLSAFSIIVVLSLGIRSSKILCLVLWLDWRIIGYKKYLSARDQQQLCNSCHRPIETLSFAYCVRESRVSIVTQNFAPSLELFLPINISSNLMVDTTPFCCLPEYQRNVYLIGRAYLQFLEEYDSSSTWGIYSSLMSGQESKITRRIGVAPAEIPCRPMVAHYRR